jgi:hypothetical protein
MTVVVGGSSPQITFADSTVQNTAFTGLNQSATPYTTSLGYQALNSNTGTSNTAVGYQAIYTNSTGTNLTAVGYQALNKHTGSYSTAVGWQAGYATTNGPIDAFGWEALTSNTSGTNNVAMGYQSLANNTTASNNTAVGYQAGYSQSSGTGNLFNTFLGSTAGYTYNGANGAVTCIGGRAGYSLTSGDSNTFVGYQSGYSVTSGSKHTIIGQYTGNQGGLNITTSSNYIVLSDGDGNPRGIFDGSGNFLVGQTAATGGSRLNVTQSSNGTVMALTGGSTGALTQIYFVNPNGGVGSITTSGSTTAYNTTSDYRLKNDVVPLASGLSTIQALNPVSFTWIDGRKDDGFIAHEIQAILPNCVTGEKDAVNEDGTPKYQQMDNSGVIPFLVKAIQELKAEFDSYKATHP